MKLLALLCLLLLIHAVAAAPPKNIGMFDGQAVQEFTLTNGKITAKFISYGAINTEMNVPDKNGKMADVVLGFDDLKSYTTSNPFFGCIAGRVGNRIANGKFKLDGKEYTLATNNAPNHLHGGNKGFDKKVWHGEHLSDKAVKFTLTSPDGDEGYPGKLDVNVTYTLTPENEWKIDYTATTDKATPINLTQHAYFNLAGHSSGNVLAQQLQLSAAKYTVTDATLIPTGELRDVKNTPFDFLVPTPLGKNIKSTGITPVGFDLNYAIDMSRRWPALAARVKDPASGRVMEVYTTEPGVQLYTGNHLDGKTIGKSGTAYPQYAGFCLECQHFPDAINHPGFKSVVLKPGETYKQTTIYKFLAE